MMMKNSRILEIAMKQSAIDSCCHADDFIRTDNVLVISGKDVKAREYLELPFLCDLTSYGDNIVASVSKELAPIVSDYMNKYPIEHCFETPNMLVFMEALKPFCMNICFMAEYFLPDADHMKPIDCGYQTKVLEAKDFHDLYLPEWSNALCSDRKQLDRLGVGAYHNGSLIGLAACSADCDSMWQIGIDVLPAYRRQGIASALTNQLALEVLSKNIVPFYCCAWSNIKSARNAIKSGFLPAWVQMTVKTDLFIDGMNNI